MNVPDGDARIEESQWELDVRPRKSKRYAYIVAAGLVLVHLILGIALRTGATGVYFQRADQVAMFLIGCGLGGGVLLLTRPRVRVGADGVLVRNVLGERLVEWDLVNSLSFPPGASWARIEIPDDEYIPVMAIQANDREYAVDAARTFRRLERKYGASPAPSDTD